MSEVSVCCGESPSSRLLDPISVGVTCMTETPTMGKLKEFKVSFDRPEGIYRTGEMIQGQLIIELAEPMKIRGVVLKFKGKARVQWDEGDDRYQKSEKYFNQEQLVTGTWNTKTNETVQLPEGKQFFPFTFTLPNNIPSSFEGEYGYVRYKVQVTIDQRYGFNHCIETPFAVIAKQLDLNMESLASFSAENRETKMARRFLCWCSSGEVTGSLRLERRGFAPGEKMAFTATVDNRSTKKIKSTYVTLYQNTTFRAEKHSTSHKHWLANYHHGEIQPGNATTFRSKDLIIPNLRPSYLTECSIIDVDYTLELHAKGRGINLVVPLNIIIGDIPLRNLSHEHAEISAAISSHGNSKPFGEASKPLAKTEFSSQPIFY